MNWTRPEFDIQRDSEAKHSKQREERMETLWNRIKKGFQTGISVTVEKTEELSKIGKLKLDIAAIRRELSSTFAQLGETIYQKAAEKRDSQLWADDEQVGALIEKIDTLRLEIRRKEEELEKIREEKERRKTEREAEGIST